VTDGGHWRAISWNSNGCLRDSVHFLPEGRARADGNTPSRSASPAVRRPPPARTFHLRESPTIPPAAICSRTIRVPQAMSLRRNRAAGGGLHKWRRGAAGTPCPGRRGGGPAGRVAKGRTGGRRTGGRSSGRPASAHQDPRRDRPARERVFICNVVKCRPPENRPAAVRRDRRVRAIPVPPDRHREAERDPRDGRTAAQTLLQYQTVAGIARNFVHRFRGIP